ncbi:hypothetical protein AB4Y45_33990 [Paraburkholderia sp. EG287A]|uniref:hypothetical protein n=1 Tax=Paraburkholderia sp. EG287A TaxID=3237012 RepID=UPI0034D1E99B
MVAIATAAPEATAERQDSPDWYDLLVEAVREPGQLSAAYKYFRNYSLCNRWLAAIQLRKLGLPLMPINTFKGWLGAERPVQREQKATISLVMPVPVKSKKKDDDAPKGKDAKAKKGAATRTPVAQPDEKEKRFTRFMLRRHWFHMEQTAGAEYQPEAVAAKDWTVETAMSFFEITERPFEFASVTDTKRMGWAGGKEISVSPLDAHPVYGRVREMARIVLGHTAAEPGKFVPTTADMRDLEAETVAYLCAATLGIEGLEEGRLRLQAAMDEAAERIPDKVANRAFAAADKLLNAGFC